MKAWVFLFLCLPSLLQATTYYVSNTGSNGNNGLTPGTAFLTIQYAENQCDPGDSVLVANGSYAGFYVDVSGTPSAPIVFMGNGNAVMITSPTSTTDGINVEGEEGATVDYIEINNFIVNDMPRNGIRLVWANNCIVRNCTCISNFERGVLTGWTDDILIEYNECAYSEDEHGIYVSNSSDRSILRYNECHHNRGGGIQINADGTLEGDGISTDPVIYGNVLYENGVGGGAAINLDGVQGAFIYNNLLYENHATGIALFQIDGSEPSYNATIVFNTIVNASNARQCVLIADGATGARIYNNIIINQHPFRGSIAVDEAAMEDYDSDYNILINSMSADEGENWITLAAWRNICGCDLNSMLADPLNDIFVNENGGDYHLTDDSQAIDAGSGTFSYGVNEDLEGNPRTGGAYDLGAYEAQDVLAIDEEDTTRVQHLNRWIDLTWSDDLLVVKGAPGDRILLSDIKGAQFRNVVAGDDGIASMETTDLVSGVYLVMLYRQDMPPAVRQIVIVRE